MISKRTKATLLAALMAAVVAVAAAPGASAAPYTGPIKELVASQFGAEVDATTGGNVCAVVSKDTCRAGRESAIAGGFTFPTGVAVAPDGNVYVTDSSRVQEFTSAGAFVGMFGWDVNATKEKEGAPQSERNVCTSLSKDVCKAGVDGTAAGQFGEGAGSVAVDRVTGNVYVQDGGNHRVDEYTGEGRFVLMIGREVNGTTKGDVCTEEEIAQAGVVCKAGVAGSGEHAAFDFTQGDGDLLAVGGPEHLLYVGDEHRVQEFDAVSGEWVGEISLKTISAEPGQQGQVLALAVDEVGDVYLAYGVTNVVRELDPEGVQINELVVHNLGEAQAEGVRVTSLALDAAGQLAVGEVDGAPSSGVHYFGALYDAGTGRQISTFTGFGGNGVAFGGGDEPELYAVAPTPEYNDSGEIVQRRSEVVAYSPVHVAELLTGQASCKLGAEVESSATFDCSLNGEVNPEEVPATTAWFQWGKTAVLGSETSKQGVATGDALVPMRASAIGGVWPNQTVYYGVAGEDETVRSPEQLTSEPTTFTTPVVPPKVVGEPSASFVTGSSAVMLGELNPENANTTYAFQYGQCSENDPQKCAESPYTGETTALESSAYGKLGATLEATGLQPASVYHYRLLASDEHEVAGKAVGGRATGAEASFTTAEAPMPRAVTGSASAIGTTFATVSGTVDPDGQPATYVFELGVYGGEATRYGVVLSGSAGAGVDPIEETLGLTGLQPGTTYAYRIKVASGYGVAYGEVGTFTTAGLPAVLSSPPSLALLATPAIAFPTEAKQTVVPRAARCASHKKLAHGKCAKRKAKKRKRGKRKKK